MPSISTIDRRNFLAILSAAGATAALAAPSFARSDLFLSSPKLVMPWDEIMPGFHTMADQTTGGNTLVVISDGHALMIDTKFAHLAGALHDDTIALAGSAAGSLALINTHHHGDHAGGNGMVVPFASASYAHTNAIPRIEEQLAKIKKAAQAGPSQIQRNHGSDALLKLAMKAADASESWTTESITPKHAVNGTLDIKIGDIKLTMHHFGAGHTDNDLVVRFENENVIHTGDLVFAGLHPFFDPSAGVSLKGWVKSLESILELCDRYTIVIPGHGLVGNTKTVETQLDYMKNLIKHVQADIDAGIPKSETAEKTWDFMKGLGFESIRGRAIATAYDELAG